MALTEEEKQKAKSELEKKDDPDKVAKVLKAVRGDDVSVTSNTRLALEQEKKIAVMIPSTESNREDVPLGINGYAILIKRDTWVKIPASFVEVLNNMVQVNYKVKKREDGEEGNELIAIPTQRIPFQMRI